MWKTVLRRILVMIPQLIILSILIFLLSKLMPGDALSGVIDPNVSPEKIEALRESLGLNNPWHVQYIDWVKNMFKGDLGVSYIYKIPVTKVIGLRAYNTFILSLSSVILTYMLALPLGILAGRYSGTKLDKAVIMYNFISMAIPTFVLSLIMLWLFGYTLKLFPTSGSVDLGIEPGTLHYYINRLYHIALPSITYALLGTVGIIQYLRNEIIDAKEMDYVKTARSKGLPIQKVYTKHIFRNSLLPIAAFLGFQITGLLGGSIFIESIFGYPGMGQLFIQSIGGRDYAVITILVLMYGMLSLIGALLSDIILSIVDPRIRVE